MASKSRFSLLATAVVVALSLALWGCSTSPSTDGPESEPSSAPTSEPVQAPEPAPTSEPVSTPEPDQTSEPYPVPIDDTTTDQMWTESVYGAEVFVVAYDGMAIIVPDGVEFNYFFYDKLQDGRFYRIVADIDYLYGGIAGYNGYPEVREIISVKEVSPDDLDIPVIGQEIAGVMRIGDYAYGDYLLITYDGAAVLSDGEWIYRYDKVKARDDGSILCYRDGADESAIEVGIANGLYCTGDYFLIPATA